MRRFLNRLEAGRELATGLKSYTRHPQAIVFGLTRGGVPVAREVARALGLPLEALVVCKLGVPDHEELAMGAIASGGGRVLNEELVRSLHITQREIEGVEARERAELERRERLYRDDRPFPNLKGRVVILVDDGLATGATMRAAIAAVKQWHPARIVVAAPIAPSDTREEIAREVDEVVTVIEPEPFVAVGLWYTHFPSVSDAEVRSAFEQSDAPSSTRSA